MRRLYVRIYFAVLASLAVFAIADIAEVLTPAQRKQLAAHFARRHGRRV